jgi:hypothetical protein
VKGVLAKRERSGMTYIEALQDAIRKSYGVESTHAETVPVKEEFEGKTVWEGNVRCSI